MEDFERGLRCQDVHAGLRNVDPNSGALAELEDTRVIGMAATLAASIRGSDVVRDAQALKSVAAEQLDVDPLAFESVLRVLDDVGFITEIKQKAGKTIGFNENVPFHQDLYSVMGQAWRDRSPNEREQSLVAVVDSLAAVPILESEIAAKIGLQARDAQGIVQLATDADLIERVTTRSGDSLLYSPFLAFEHPDVIAEMMEGHGSDRISEAFAKVRAYQGLPIDDETDPVLFEAISRGLLTAPSVLRPDHIEQPFATIPYVADRSLLTTRKAVLEKSLAIVACVRCGQNFGGATSIRSPLAILDRLLNEDGDYTLGPHGSARRQYQLLFRMQVVEFIPSGRWVQVRLVPTEDNLAAVRLARELLSHGQVFEDRLGGDDAIRQLLGSNDLYAAPIQTTAKTRRRRKRSLSEGEFGDLMARMMDRRPS